MILTLTVSDNEHDSVDVSTDGLPDFLAEGVELVQPVLKIVPNVMVTLGKNGVLMCRNCDHDETFPTIWNPSEVVIQLTGQVFF